MDSVKRSPTALATASDTTTGLGAASHRADRRKGHNLTHEMLQDIGRKGIGVGHGLPKDGPKQCV